MNEKERAAWSGGGGDKRTLDERRSQSLYTSQGGMSTHYSVDLFTEYAKLYSALSFRVVPLAWREKRPVEREWNKRELSKDEIEGVFQHERNIGIQCGAVSGNLVVLDFDGEDWEKAFKRFHVATQSLLDNTPVVITGSGKRHIYLRVADLHEDTRRRSYHVRDLDAIIELRANDHQVAAPPSVHPAGDAYEWAILAQSGEVRRVEHDALRQVLGQLVSIEYKELDRYLRSISDPTPWPVQYIREGERNTTLTRFGGKMRREGANESEIYERLSEINKRYCTPPLAEREVATIARSVSKYQPAMQLRDYGYIPPAGKRDYSHASVLAELLNNRVRYVNKNAVWLRYNGAYWERISESEIIKLASDTLREHYTTQLESASGNARELRELINDTYAHARMNACVAFLKGWENIATDPSQFDAIPWVLNCENGTLDLRTFELKKHDPRDLLTKSTRTAYTAGEAIKWKEHLLRVFDNNADKVRQLQRQLGVAVTGEHLTERLYMWIGSGANGKTVTQQVVLSVLGDYAGKLPHASLTNAHGERPSLLYDSVRGLRVGFVAEAAQSSHLNEALVKELTGGDALKSRALYRDFEQFTPEISVILVSNHKPVIAGDEGIWRRIELLLFEHVFSEEEKKSQAELLKELNSEKHEILSWIVEGLKDYLSEPEWTARSVEEDTKEYKSEQDVVQAFLESDFVHLEPGGKVAGGALYSVFAEWAEQNGERRLSKKTFASQLKQKNMKQLKSNSIRYWQDISLTERGQAVAGRALVIDRSESDPA